MALPDEKVLRQEVTREQATLAWKAEETSDEEKGNKWKGTEQPTQQTREMIITAGL